MKKVIVFLVTAAMLLSSVSFAAMVIPSETSPNPLSAVNSTSDSFYGQLDIVPETASNGTTSGAMIYNNYLVVPTVFYDIFDDTRNTITVYDLSLNEPQEFAQWNFGDMGVHYYPTSATDNTPIANKFQQNTIYQIEMDSDYIYVVSAYQRNPYLYVFTNPLGGEVEYDDLGSPIIKTPTLVSGPAAIISGCINVDQVWSFDIQPKLHKVGNYLIYVYVNRSIGNQCLAYIDVSDAANPTAKAFDAASLFSVNGKTPDADSTILGASFEGNIGYITVSNDKGASAWETATLYKIDFSHPKSPVVTGTLTLDSGDTLSAASGSGNMLPVNICGDKIYISLVNIQNGKLNPHFWSIDKNAMEIKDEIKGNSNIKDMGYIYDTGDMLIGVRTSNYARVTTAFRFGEKGEDGQTTVETVKLGAIQDMQAATQLDAFPLGILEYGTKLYFPMGLGGAFGKNVYKQATVCYIDMDEFSPFTFTVDTLPSVFYDEAKISGSICTPATAGEVGVHLYINGAKDPVDAEIEYDTVFGSVVAKWSYTVTESGKYSVVAKLYDEYGDYDNIGETVSFTLKTTTGINADTSYSVLDEEPVTELAGTFERIFVDGFNGSPETWVTGIERQSGYFLASVTNFGLYATTTKVDSTAEKDEDGNYIIDESLAAKRNKLVFCKTDENGELSVVKEYDGAALGMSSTLSWNKPSRVTSNATIYGMTVDEDYIYLFVTEPKANHYVVNEAIYIYENPYNAQTKTFADEINKVSGIVVNSSANMMGAMTNNYGIYDGLLKIVSGGEEYLVFSDFYNSSYGVYKVTDKTAPVKVAYTSALNLNDGEITLSRIDDMEFDGNYLYISGANSGTVDNDAQTLTDAYYAVIKVDFKNPAEPTVEKSYKVREVGYEWLNRAGHSSYANNKALHPKCLLDISGGKVIATLVTTEQYLAQDIKDQLGSLCAYVLGDEITHLFAAGITTGKTASGRTTAYSNGAEHVYYINGLYWAENWNAYDNGRAGNSYVIGYPEKFEENAANSAKRAYHSEIPVGARILNIIEIDGMVYANYWLAYYNGISGGDLTTYGGIGTLDFNSVDKYNAKNAVESSEDYYASITIENNKSTEETITPVAALFKGDLLVDVAVGEATAVKANSKKTVTLSVSVPSDTAYGEYIIKTYVFETINNIKPLTMSMSMAD